MTPPTMLFSGNINNKINIEKLRKSCPLLMEVFLSSHSPCQSLWAKVHTALNARKQLIQLPWQQESAETQLPAALTCLDDHWWSLIPVTLLSAKNVSHHDGQNAKCPLKFRHCGFDLLALACNLRSGFLSHHDGARASHYRRAQSVRARSCLWHLLAMSVDLLKVQRSWWSYMEDIPGALS